MDVKILQETNIAVIENISVLICDIQTAFELMMLVEYETNCDRIIIEKSAICERFFNFKNRLALELLQKFSDYDVKLAIVGDFTKYKNNSIEEFICECNSGKSMFFVDSENEAIETLSCLE